MITFTRTRPGAFNAADNTMGAPVITTIAGNAVQVRGTPQTYASLSLIESAAPTLLFTPSTYGYLANSDGFVLPGDTVVWAGETYIVKDVTPIAPDGVVIAARIVVSK